MNKHSPRIMRKSRARHIGKRFSHKVNPAGTKLARKAVDHKLTVR